jgi:hypothetical protein
VLTSWSTLVLLSVVSWGPGGLCTEAGCILASMYPLVTSSILDGADKGRDGRGVVYVFAAGNDAVLGGTTSMTHYSKLPEVMTIAACDQNGQRTYYSTRGSGLFVTAPSGGLHKGGSIPGKYSSPSLPILHYSSHYCLLLAIVVWLIIGIITALSGVASSVSGCYGGFGGTSSATPLVAGIAAQILGVRPDLTWRDVQHIIRATADRIDLTTSDEGWGEAWFQNGAGIWYSYQHGFGRINAGNAVSLAKIWSLVGPVAGMYQSFHYTTYHSVMDSIRAAFAHIRHAIIL